MMEKETASITIHDVAEVAGVSISTVSRVVNDLGRVAPETRRKVELAIRRLNFQPNSRAQALSRKRTDTIGLIVPDFEALGEYAQSRGLRYTDRGDLVRLREIYQLIEADIQHLQKDLANYERVRKFRLLDKPFTIEDGELTPTQKVRRKVVEERYANLIDGMYEGIS